MRIVLLSLSLLFLVGCGGTWTSANLEEFTADANGVLTYIGIATKQLLVPYYALFEKAGGGSTDIELTLLKNTTTEISNNAPRSVNAGVIQISGSDIVTMSTGDTIELGVTNRSGTSDINVSQANIVAIRG